jgi:hypothetical protein
MKALTEERLGEIPYEELDAAEIYSLRARLFGYPRNHPNVKRALRRATKRINKEMEIMQCTECSCKAPLFEGDYKPGYSRCAFCGQIYDAKSKPVDMSAVAMCCGVPPERTSAKI